MLVLHLNLLYYIVLVVFGEFLNIQNVISLVIYFQFTFFTELLYGYMSDKTKLNPSFLCRSW